MERILNRRLCRSCDRDYSRLALRPGRCEICEACGDRLVQGSDDNPGAIRQRLGDYHAQTEPITRRQMVARVRMVGFACRKPAVRMGVASLPSERMTRRNAPWTGQWVSARASTNSGLAAAAPVPIGTFMQEGLMQSLSRIPGQAEVIRVFPAWPKGWDATFALVARGAFLVRSTMKKGVISFVEIESRVGGACQIHNPWTAPCFLAESGKETKRQTGNVIRFETEAGGTYRLFPDDLPDPILIAPKPGLTPTSFSLTLPDGKQLKGSLGRGA